MKKKIELKQKLIKQIKIESEAKKKELEMAE